MLNDRKKKRQKHLNRCVIVLVCLLSLETPTKFSIDIERKKSKETQKENVRIRRRFRPKNKDVRGRLFLSFIRYKFSSNQFDIIRIPFSHRRCSPLTKFLFFSLSFSVFVMNEVLLIRYAHPIRSILQRKFINHRSSFTAKQWRK